MLCGDEDLQRLQARKTRFTAFHCLLLFCSTFSPRLGREWGRQMPSRGLRVVSSRHQKRVKSSEALGWRADPLGAKLGHI